MNPEELMLMLRRYEEKLKEYMTEEEYIEFSCQVAKEAFFNELSKLPDSDFKDFAIDNFHHITGSPEEFARWAEQMLDGDQEEDDD